MPVLSMTKYVKETWKRKITVNICPFIFGLTDFRHAENSSTAQISEWDLFDFESENDGVFSSGLLERYENASLESA